MLEQLKKFDSDTTTLDELLALRAFGKALKGEYEAEKASVPEWLTSRLAELDRVIHLAFEDRKAKRVKELKASLTTLETAGEKRARIEAELKELTGAAQ